jgi:hypothetical protein
VIDWLVESNFIELQNKRKVKRIILLDGLLWWKQLYVYVLERKLCMEVMQEVHDMSMAKHHEEKTTTWVILSDMFYWPKMKEDIEVHYVCICVKCQSTKLVCKKKFRLYRPFLILKNPFENILMDFVTCFPKCQGKDAILVVVDRFSKLANLHQIKPQCQW